jgi:hypothetical protein
VASDIILVLRSDHRELRVLADQCRRPSRGFERPDEDLHRRLTAHTQAAQEIVYPAAAQAAGSTGESEFRQVLAAVHAQLENPSREGLADAACALVECESTLVIPTLDTLIIEDRRRMGKVFRIHRERSLRHSVSAGRRQRSQTELYELARRAGLEQRSRMTQAQLEEAVSAWERAHAPRSGNTG